MSQTLARPVELGALRIAPTTELAALADLGAAPTLRARIDVLVAVAHALRAEDLERERIGARVDGDTAGTLPRRR